MTCHFKDSEVIIVQTMSVVRLLNILKNCLILFSAITALSRAARFVCDQCGYLAANPTDLKTHKESKHEGIRYPCDQCDYIAKLPSYLKKHKRSRHAL